MLADRLFRSVPRSDGAPLGVDLAELGTVRRVDALFRAMATDYLLREQFVTGPSNVVSDYVHGVQLPVEQAQASDHLIYAVMANRGLLEGLHELLSNTDGPLSRNQYAYLFARAAAASNASHVIIAFMRCSSMAQHPVGLDEILLALSARRLPVVQTDDGGTGTGTGDGGTGTGTGDGGTGTGTGDGGTGTDAPDGGTGTFTAITLSTYITGTGDGGTGTTPFTYTGMTRSPFTTHTTALAEQSGDVFDPAYVLVTLDALFQYSNLLREQGALDFAFAM